jgi:hypothetical protein
MTRRAGVRVPLPDVCHIRHPRSELRCTLPVGHGGNHVNYYAGITNSSGIRPGVSWRRKTGETQAD